MEPETRFEKVIQSYVYTKFGNFFVSTAFRLSSAMIQTWYYETLVWKLNDQNKREESILYESEGLKNHYEICRQLIEKGSYSEDD